MEKMTLEDLHKVRNQMKPELMKREPEGKKLQVIVGLDTCGIEAGAKAVLDAFVNEVDSKGLGGDSVEVAEMKFSIARAILTTYYWRYDRMWDTTNERNNKLIDGWTIR